MVAGDLFNEQVSSAPLQLGLSLAFSAATIAVVYFGVSKGIERVARIFLPILFGILILMLVSALGMSGSGEALTFIFRPNFGELEPSSVLEAVGHSFFTLSLGMGAMITYGSYISRKQSVVKASGAIVALDTIIALFATIIMFSVIFSVTGMQQQVDAGEVGAVGMLFVALPELFYTQVPFGVVLGPLFYVLVALAALTSTISLLEVVTSYLIDERGIARNRATVVSGAPRSSSSRSSRPCPSPALRSSRHSRSSRGKRAGSPPPTTSSPTGCCRSAASGSRSRSAGS